MTGKRAVLGLAVAALAMAAVLLAPAPPGLSAQAQRVLAVVVLAVLLWITEPVPAAVTGLAVVVLLPLTGAMPLPQALYGFSQPLVYFLFGALALGLGASASGLAERAARYIIARSRANTTAFYFVAMFLFAPLALVLPSAATRGAILTPIYDHAIGIMGVARGGPTARATMLGLAILNRLASTALLTGGLVPVTAAAVLGGFSWTRWFVLMAVPYYTLVVLGALLIYVLYHRSREAASPRAAPPNAANGISGREVRMLVIALAVSFLWVTDSVHHLEPAVPALLGAIAALSPRIGVLDWATLERNIAWSIVFILASALSLAYALVTSGASVWLAGALTGLLSPYAAQPMLILIFLMLATVLLRMAVPSFSGFLPVILPIVLAFAQQMGMNPILTALVVVIVGDSVVFYPAQGAASSLLSYERGHFSTGELLTTGVGVTLLALLVVLLVALPYWALLGERLWP